MFFFAHVGITTVTAGIINRYSINRENESHSCIFTAYPEPEAENVNNLDFRLIIPGSVLPGIIEKPVGLFFPHLGMGTGRGVGHTLIFNLLLVGIGWYLYRRGRSGFL
ncbi:MAG: hypothetical protein M0Z41_21190 [Peptococcaceae bacterium]|jgi:uncharacterized membrane protein YqaE (UPF0057 family)|nr:hypothetical protein [Peptococcaceae bacterium]